MRIFLAITLLCWACGDDDGVELDASADTSTADAPERDAPVEDGSMDDAVATDAPAEDAAAADSGPEVECGDLMSVGSADAIAALAPAMYGNPARAADAQDSGDLEAAVAITLSGDAFPSPGDCEDCPVFLGGAAPGVTRQPDGSYAIEAGARFRLRFRLSISGIASGSAQFSPACADPCEASADRCDVDNACYPRGEDVCLGCDGREASECACITAENLPEPDGTECQYVLGGDAIVVGVCMDGVCSSR